MDAFIKENKTNLEYIEISDFFGNKNFKFTFEDSIKVLLAENGSGKTTILNIIVHVLRGEFKQITKYEFSKIKIKFKKKK